MAVDVVQLDEHRCEATVRALCQPAGGVVADAVGSAIVNAWPGSRGRVPKPPYVPQKGGARWRQWRADWQRMKADVDRGLSNVALGTNHDLHPDTVSRIVKAGVKEFLA